MVIFALVFAVLLSVSITNIQRGPSSADNAWTALAAKNLTEGKGYATSKTSSEQIYFC